jgi:IclR family acetate operon transcriptional repressor
MLRGLDPGDYLGPILRELHQEAGHTVHFALLSGDEAVCVETLEPQGAPYRVASRVGGRLALHCTSIGKALLAAMPENETGAVLERIELTPRTAKTLVSEAALEADLEQVRRLGFALEDEENEEHIRCIGAAVYDHHARPIGAVSVAALGFEVDRPRLLELAPLVVSAATALSTALGAPMG